MIRYFFYIALCLCFFQTEAGYNRNPDIDPILWESLKPYFLPEDLAVKKKLDQIFSKSRVLLNTNTVRQAGFKDPTPRGFTHTIVSKHPKLKGYIVKMFTDDQNINDGESWKKRIDGAKLIKEAIQKQRYQNYFKVPKKWIYPIPQTSTAAGPFRKNFILIAEDMKICNKKTNAKKWQSSFMGKKRLHAIYTLMNEHGLDDSGLANNLPFTYDGKQAFVDTERYQRWPIDFGKTNQFLSPKMKEYWMKLTNNNGP